MKLTSILIIGILVISAMTAGCMDGSTTQQVTQVQVTTKALSSYTPVKTTNVTITNVTTQRTKNNGLVFKGFIVNNDSVKHSVSAYIDLYDNKAKMLDHLLISVNVDAHGNSSFETMSTVAKDYTNVTFRKYIESVS
jgi:hypothetical protein